MKGYILENTLHEIFPLEWDDGQPAKIFDLITAEYESLNDKAKMLRAQVIETIHGFERKPILTPADARRLMEEHHLPKYKGKWVIVALNEKREKIYQKVEKGGLRLVSLMREYIPRSYATLKDVPVPKKGGYILIYSGSPDVLEDEKAFERFIDLNKHSKIFDVIIWEEREESATFWSVAAQTGAIGNSYVDFPNQTTAKKWRDIFV